MPMLFDVSSGKVKRHLRKPEFKFHLATQRPYEIRPFMIHPVLMGETLKLLDWKSISRSDPLADRFLGAWLEQGFWYVKLRDLEERAEMEKFMTRQTVDWTNLNKTANAYRYHGGSGVDWVYACMERIVDEYFRHDGETIANHADAVTGMPLARLHEMPHRAGVLDSMVKESTLEAATPDVAVGDMTDFQQSYLIWEAAMRDSMVQMTFEDFLAMGGVRPQLSESHIPEWIAFRKDWTLPKTGTDQNDGTTQSVWFWSMDGEQKKPKKFDEPGFIIGLQWYRPKVYISKQTSTQVAMLTEWVSWLPPHLRGMAYSGLYKLTAHAEPFADLDVAGDNSEGVYIDFMDLFNYGDQFTDLAPANLPGAVAVPTNTLDRKWYPTQAEQEALFSGIVYKMITEGVGRMHIASSDVQPDTTPGILRNQNVMGYAPLAG